METFFSGNTAWNAPNNKPLQSEAERIAKEMEDDMNRQREENGTCKEG